MKRSSLLEEILQHLELGGSLRLFLDYDGTLVPIARTPDQAKPDAALLQVLSELGRNPALDVTILSGRPLPWLRKMLPVPGITLAGTYGVQVQWANGDFISHSDTALVRPTIERVRAEWSNLIAGTTGFLLEDKGLGIALHARFAEEASAGAILPNAKSVARHIIDPAELRIIGGERFLEVAPATAHKGLTVEWFLQSNSRAYEKTVYFGDDDKDEEAFLVVRERGGIPIIVGSRQPETRALVRLPDPLAVREWLGTLILRRPSGVVVPGFSSNQRPAMDEQA